MLPLLTCSKSLQGGVAGSRAKPCLGEFVGFSAQLNHANGLGEDSASKM